MSGRARNETARAVSALALLAALAITPATPARAQKPRLARSVPTAVARATEVGALEPSREIGFAITLPLRDPAGLDALLKSLYTPGDPLYRRYLKTDEFTERFGPTQADYDAVIAFARANGLRVTRTYANRAVLDVAGPVPAIESALHVRMKRYRSPEGRLFRAPGAEPQPPADIAARVSGFVGLDDAVEPRSNLRRFVEPPAGALPSASGTGPGQTLAPSDIKTAYGLNGISQTGAGQTIALFELDGYRPSDITAYEDQFGLPHVALANTLLNGVTGAPTAPTPKNPYPAGPGEVTLDIELAIALCPGLSQVHVYEGNNVVDMYSQIANDNSAQQVSTSWYYGLDSDPPDAVRSGEATAFQQMASQGQSLFGASGDFGDQVCVGRDSLGNCTTQQFGVQDPSAQPYCTAVGGTIVTTGLPGDPWESETTWSGSGGGISTVWGLPYYQSAAVTPGSNGSASMRNVPDVALDSASGYAIYYYGLWQSFTGTSCAAPLWAGFTALVNQHRAAGGLGNAGFLNPALYYLGHTARYGQDFHDITTGNNGTYAAVTGFDDVTGWGTINGGGLFNDLSLDVGVYWVDTHYTGIFQVGTPAFPYKTLSAALGFVPGNTPWLIYVRGGAYLENPTSSKNVLIVNNGGGVVTIGN